MFPTIKIVLYHRTVANGYHTKLYMTHYIGVIILKLYCLCVCVCIHFEGNIKCPVSSRYISNTSTHRTNTHRCDLASNRLLYSMCHYTFVYITSPFIGIYIAICIVMSHILNDIIIIETMIYKIFACVLHVVLSPTIP